MLRRRSDWANPITSIDKAFESTALRGEVAGIQFIIGLPRVMILDLQVDIERLLEEEREAAEQANKE